MQIKTLKKLKGKSKGRLLLWGPSWVWVQMWGQLVEGRSWSAGGLGLQCEVYSAGETVLELGSLTFCLDVFYGRTNVLVLVSCLALSMKIDSKCPVISIVLFY